MAWTVRLEYEEFCIGYDLISERKSFADDKDWWMKYQP